MSNSKAKTPTINLAPSSSSLTLEQKLDLLQSQLDRANSALHDAQTSIARSQSELSSARATLTDKQNELAKLQATTNGLLRSKAIGYVVCDSLGNILDVNDALLEMIQYAREDFRKGLINWRALTPPEYAQLDARAIQQCLTIGEAEPYEKEYIRKDGTRTSIFIGGSRVEGTNDQFVCYVIDISKRKEYERELLRSTQALAQSRKLFDAVLNQLPVGVIVALPPDGKIILGNKAISEIWKQPFSCLGKNENDSIWKGYSESGSLIETDKWPLFRALRGERVENEIIRIERADGTTRITENSASAIFGEQGKIIGAVATAKDVTARKETEAELKKTKEVAIAANEAKTRFLANMSHEIRTPMNSILGFADLILDPEASEHDKVSYIQRIKTSGDQLLHLIDDILDLARVEVGEFKLDTAQFDPATVLNDLFQSMLPIANRKNLRLALDTTGLPHKFSSDPMRFRQVINNLLSNAIKFTERGQITIRSSVETPPSKDQQSNGTFVIEVEDSGIGIARSDQPKLFRPFSQADMSITRRFGGTGLGLSLSYHLAHLLGGELILKWSTPGAGSCFSLRLPISREELASVEQIKSESTGDSRSPSNGREGEIESRKKPLHKYKVLVVEDSSDNEFLIASYLRKAGAEFAVAHNGLEAIEFACNGQFDLVLMDIQMPILDGLEATKRLRSLGFKKPILALTAHALQEEVAKSIQAGCNEHLTKPIDRQTLVDSILKFYRH